MEWVEDIVLDFINKKFKQSKGSTELEKANEVYEYITSKSAIELSDELKNTKYDINYTRKYAVSAAYQLMGKCLWRMTCGKKS